MSLEIRHLKLMLAVSEDGSLTRAARRLHLTQSALSHQLRDAEKTLGRPLFLREKKQMRLTAAGERLLRSAQEILDELDSTEREIRESRPGPEGTIRVATECNTCYHWLPAALETFGKKYPAVDVQVVVEATHEPVPALLDGRIDVGIVSDPVKNSRLAVEALFEDELVAVLPADHSLRREPFLDAADFADEQLITYDAPREELTVFQQVLVPAGALGRRALHAAGRPRHQADHARRPPAPVERCVGETPAAAWIPRRLRPLPGSRGEPRRVQPAAQRDARLTP